MTAPRTVADLRKGDSLNLPGVGQITVDQVKVGQSLMNGAWIRNAPMTSVCVDKEVYTFASNAKVGDVERKTQKPRSQPKPDLRRRASV